MKNFTEKQLLQNNLNEATRFSKMLSKTVHDINNPLAVLIGQLSIVDILKERDQFTQEKQDIIFEKLNSSAKIFKERLDNLREFYKVLLNDSSFEKISDIFKSVHYYFEPELYEHSVSLKMEAQEEVSTRIPSAELFYVLKHLIQNSLESLVENKVSNPEILVNSVLKNNSIEITVQDNGPKFIAELQTLLSPGHTTKNQVTHPGLGLSLVQSILNSVNSEINYNYQEKLNTITFTIPSK